MCCTWTCLDKRSLICIWKCLENRSLCWSGHYYPIRAWTTLGCVRKTEACAGLDITTPQATLAWITLGCVWTKGACSSLDAYTLGALAAPGRVYCLHYRGLYCTWTCLHHRGLSWAAPARVYTTEAFAAHGSVCTTEPWSVFHGRYTKFCTWKLSWNSAKLCPTMRPEIPRNSAKF